MSTNTFVHGVGALNPVKFERGGAWYSAHKTHETASAFIAHGTTYFSHRVRQMNKDISTATELTNEAFALFGKSMDALLERQKEIGETTKKVSGQVRDATQKLSEGLAKIEKVANFDRLERLVNLLERSSTAMTALAELDAAGKLAKIADVLR